MITQPRIPQLSPLTARVVFQFRPSKDSNWQEIFRQPITYLAEETLTERLLLERVVDALDDGRIRITFNHTVAISSSNRTDWTVTHFKEPVDP